MLYTCRLAHFVQIGGTPGLEHLSFREPFAHLSQICSTKSLIHMSTHVSFRGFRGALLLSRAFANQHFPFAQAPQINLHIKVNVRGFFRSSNVKKTPAQVLYCDLTSLFLGFWQVEISRIIVWFCLLHEHSGPFMGSMSQHVLQMDSFNPTRFNALQ